MFSFHQMLLNRDCAAKFVVKLCEARLVPNMPRTSAVVVS